MISTRLSVPYPPATLPSSSIRQTRGPGLPERVDSFQSRAFLMFRGVLEQVTEVAEKSQAEIQNKLLTSEKPMLTLNGTPLKPIEVLTLLGDMDNKHCIFAAKFSAAGGGIASLAGVLTIGGIGFPLLAGSLGFVFLFCAFAVGAGVNEEYVKKLDAKNDQSFMADVHEAFQTFEKAGLLTKHADGKYLMSKMGRKLVEEYRQQHGEDSVAGKLGTEVKKPASQSTKGFDYTSLTAEQRASVFETLTSAGKGGAISGFQFLEKLQELEKRTSYLSRLFSKGMTEKQVLGLLSDSDQAWGRNLLQAFRALGWVRLEPGKTPKCFLTDAGRQAIALGDPVFTGVMTPDDLHQVFQNRIERLEAEKVEKRQNLTALQLEFDKVTARIQELEAQVAKLQRGDVSGLPADAALSEVPLAVRLDRAQRELELSRKLVERFKLAIEAKTTLVQKETAQIDARVTALLDGQVQVKVQKLDHSLAEILRQFNGDLGGMQDAGDELLLAKLNGNPSETAGEGERISLEVTTNQLLQDLAKSENAQGNAVSS